MIICVEIEEGVLTSNEAFKILKDFSINSYLFFRLRGIRESRIETILTIENNLLS